MINPPTPRRAILLGACVLCVASSQAAVVFFEDFGSTTANPTTNPFSVTGGQTWNYSDSNGTTVDSNESRLYNPGAGGAGTSSVGWITQKNGSNSYQQIQSGGTFSDLPVLNPGESYQITLSWFAASETTNEVTNNAYVSFATVGADLTFVSGGNGDSTVTLANASADPDRALINFESKGGNQGFNAARTFTATFSSTTELNGTDFEIALGMTSGGAFLYYDNVSLDVSVVSVPEPSAALLGGIGALALLRRRRA